MVLFNYYGALPSKIITTDLHLKKVLIVAPMLLSDLYLQKIALEITQQTIHLVIFIQEKVKNNWYRLRQEDLDGKFSSSAVISVKPAIVKDNFIVFSNNGSIYIYNKGNVLIFFIECTRCHWPIRIQRNVDR